MSLVIFCFLFSSVDYVPVKGEIIWYLSLTAWLISLSIMLSSFIHAVAQEGGWRWGREVGSAGVGWRDGEKRHTTVIE